MLSHEVVCALHLLCAHSARWATLEVVAASSSRCMPAAPPLDGVAVQHLFRRLERCAQCCQALSSAEPLLTTRRGPPLLCELGRAGEGCSRR